jgi:hypothetical protein
MEMPTTEEVGRALQDGPADAEVEEEDVEGRRREAQNFLGGAGAAAAGVAVNMGKAA